MTCACESYVCDRRQGDRRRDHQQARERELASFWAEMASIRCASKCYQLQRLHAHAVETSRQLGVQLTCVYVCVCVRRWCPVLAPQALPVGLPACTLPGAALLAAPEAVRPDTDMWLASATLHILDGESRLVRALHP